MSVKLQPMQFLERKKQLNDLDPQFRSLAYQLHRIPSCATIGEGSAGYIQYLRSGETFHLNKCTMSLRGHLDFICDLDGSFASGLISAVEEKIADLEIPDVSFEPYCHPQGPPEISSLQVWQISFGDDGILSLFGNPSGIFNPSDYPLAFEQARLHYREMRRSWQRLSQAVRAFADLEELSPHPNIMMRVRELTEKWIK